MPIISLPYQRLLRLDQAIFGLPFVIMGSLLANWDCGKWPRLDLLCFFLVGFLVARSSGMAFNQYIDWKIDAKNQRTSSRPIPKGEIHPRKACFLAWGSLVLFLIVTWFYSHILFYVALPVSFLIVIYSYTKRFTSLCHFILGLIHFSSPIMAYMASSETLSPSTLILGFVPFWCISGSDILYAMGDFEFDRKEGLHSLPSLLGLKKAYLVAVVCQISSLLFLLLFGIFFRGPLFLALPIILSGILFYIHYRKKSPLIFNGFLSTLSLLFLLLDRAWADIF